MQNAPSRSQILSPSEEADKPLELQGLLHALLRRSWLIFLMASAGGLLGAWYVQRLPQLYISKTVVEIEAQEQKAIKLKDEDQRDLRSPDIIQTILQNFRNRSLMERVSQALKLSADEEFLGRKVKEPASADEVVQLLLGQSNAGMRQNTRLVDVTFTHRDPRIAQKISGALVDQFLELGAEQRMKTMETQNAVLVKKAAELKAKLDQSEHLMLDYKNNLQTVSLEERRNLVDEKLKALNADLNSAKSERLRIEADLASVRDPAISLQDLQNVASVMQDPAVGAARQRLNDAEAERAQLAERYRDKHPDMIAAKAKLVMASNSFDEAIQTAPGRLTARYNEAVTREKGLQDAVSEQEKAALALDEKIIPYRALERDRESDKALYESVLGHLKESTLALGIEPISFRIVEPAVPADAVPIKSLQIIGTATVGGFMLGALLLAALYFVDSSLRTVDDAERLIGLPVLAAIPFMEKLKTRHEGLAMSENPDSPVAESFRLLRSSLSMLGPESERRVFLVSSAIPGEGKTTVSGNIAIAFAQQGLRTLLIDADLRRPALTKLFEVGAEAGVAEYITGEEVTLVASNVENLSILSAGHKAPNPAELLANPRFSELITSVKEQFDRIVIDSAPLNIVSDTFSIVGCASTIILVARHGSTPRKVIRRALELLQRANVRPAGLVLNCMPKWNGVGYHYYYSYNSKYGRDQTYGQAYQNGTNGANGSNGTNGSGIGTGAPEKKFRGELGISDVRK